MTILSITSGKIFVIFLIVVYFICLFIAYKGAQIDNDAE